MKSGDLGGDHAVDRAKVVGRNRSHQEHVARRALLLHGPARVLRCHRTVNNTRCRSSCIFEVRASPEDRIRLLLSLFSLACPAVLKDDHNIVNLLDEWES